MKEKIKISEIISYLELKLLSNTYSEREYLLYSEYKWNGKEVFKESIHKKTVKQLRNEIRREERNNHH